MRCGVDALSAEARSQDRVVVAASRDLWKLAELNIQLSRVGALERLDDMCSGGGAWTAEHLFPLDDVEI